MLSRFQRCSRFAATFLFRGLIGLIGLIRLIGLIDRSDRSDRSDPSANKDRRLPIGLIGLIRPRKKTEDC